MNNTFLIRCARRAQAANTWLDAKSEIGSFLTGEDGPVSRKEVLMVNIIAILLAVGVLSADGALWLTALCASCAGVLIGMLNKGNEKNTN